MTVLDWVMYIVGGWCLLGYLGMFLAGVFDKEKIAFIPMLSAMLALEAGWKVNSILFKKKNMLRGYAEHDGVVEIDTKK